MGELKNTEVYVKIKDDEHLNELFEICEKFYQGIEKSVYNEKLNCFKQSVNHTESNFSNFCYNRHFTEVMTVQFEELLRVENGH